MCMTLIQALVADQGQFFSKPCTVLLKVKLTAVGLHLVFSYCYKRACYNISRDGMNFYALFLLISKLLQLLLELLRKEMLKQTISSPSKPRKTSRTSWIKKSPQWSVNGCPTLHLAGIVIFLPGTVSLHKSVAHCRQHKCCSWSCEAWRLLVMLWYAPDMECMGR